MRSTARRGSWFTRRPGLAAASVCAALGALAAPAAAAPPSASAPPSVTVSHQWMRFLTPQIPAAGYMTLHNGGSRPTVLTGAASPGCGMLMLHRSIVQSGVAKMVMVQSVTVPSHGSIAFQPGGYHLMCMQPAADVRPGKHVPVSLTFEGGGTLSVVFPVYGAKGK